ncbi:MAG: AAA family ATPase [Chitinivibrionales bacterium]|nr:AAA family ATPase [Chitinivibrionales bacterium]
MTKHLNAQTLNAELDWFYRILDTRFKLYFGHECAYRDVVDVAPPPLEHVQSAYAQFVKQHDFGAHERIVFVLSLIPHIRPQLLDMFFAKNATYDRPFTEFGGYFSSNGQSIFLPTAETALFILAGGNLGRRLSYNYLFEADHTFVNRNILRFDRINHFHPYLSGTLHLSKEILNLVTTGNMGRPVFGAEFPAKRIDTEFDWDDLVLNPHSLKQVLEIKAWVEFGDRVLNEMELKKKLKPGYRSLFYGPSGTGKTLAASLLGKVSQRDVYRIDLSMVISKYIGETEKNLEKIFSQAEHRDWILFFDEADALFGKRTQISDAHDRFANQEIAYLLQRVEDYDGVVILASNMRSNLDEAFARRFQSIIHFPMPGEQERLRLWQNSFSHKTPLQRNVDLMQIAAKYEVSGGTIMNIVRYTTLMAVSKNRLFIAKEDLIEGIRREFHKEGKTL